MPLLANSNTCTGCTACSAVCPRGCISMVPDENGFVFPQVDEAFCVNCGLCTETCPVLSERDMERELPAAYAAYSKNDAIRWRSSSGGVFSELARYVLAHDGVVFGAAYDERFRVVHTCVEAEEQLYILCGAKYSQSDLGNTYAQVRNRLEQGQWVLFSGTPCQVAGLKCFLKKKYKHLLAVDFVCHGIPAPAVWQQYVKFRGKVDADGVHPVCINLRSKESGWSRYAYSCRFEYPDGIVRSEQSGNSIFMKLFVQDGINRKSCSDCKFKGFMRVSDITLGDFWGIWDIAPEMDDNYGTSVILIQSQLGQRVFEQIVGHCAVQKVSLGDAVAQNQSMVGSSTSHKNRKKILESARQGDFEACASLLYCPAGSFRSRIVESMKKQIKKGTLVRHTRVP